MILTFSDLCLAEIKSLAYIGLINYDNNKINSRPEGEIMAKYLISFETMKSFMHVRSVVIMIIYLLQKKHKGNQNIFNLLAKHFILFYQSLVF